MEDLQLQQMANVTRRQLFIRGLYSQCPNCGQAKLFKTPLRIHRYCPKCGMQIERGDGYYLGPLSINYSITVFTVVLPSLLLGFFGYITIKHALVVAFTGALLLPVLLYRLSWSCWLMIYYICLAQELPANQTEDCDDLCFEEERRTRTKR